MQLYIYIYICKYMVYKYIHIRRCITMMCIISFFEKTLHQTSGSQALSGSDSMKGDKHNSIVFEKSQQPFCKNTLNIYKICIYIYIYIYIYIFQFLYIYIYIHTYQCVRVCAHIYIYIYLQNIYLLTIYIYMNMVSIFLL